MVSAAAAVSLQNPLPLAGVRRHRPGLVTVKIHVVLTPSTKLLDEPGSVGALLKAVRVNQVPVDSGTARVELDIEVSDTPESSAGVAPLCRSIEENFARSAPDGAQLRLEIPGVSRDLPSAAPAESSAGLAGTAAWTPDAQKLHDVNGSRANAALSRVLAAVRKSDGGRPQNSAAKVTLDGVERSVAITYDRSSPHGQRDAHRGTLISVVDCVRQLACRGTSPLAIGYWLNFPTVAGVAELQKIDAALKALATACTSLAIPSIVSLAAVERDAFVPISGLWAIGCLEQERHMTGSVVRGVGERLMFLGEAPTELGGSVFLAAVHDLAVGDAPAVQLGAEKRLQNVLLTLIRAGVISAARNVSSGGLMTAVCQMLLAADQTFGARLDLTPLGGARADALLFGESQGHVILAVPAERVGTVLSEAHMRGVSAALIGDVTAGPSLGLKTRSLETEWAIANLSAAQ